MVYLLKFSGTLCVVSGILYVDVAPIGVCETFQKKDVLEVSHDSGFSRALGYMVDCRCRVVYCGRCTSSWLPYDTSRGELSDVPWRSAIFDLGL